MEIRNFKIEDRIGWISMRAKLWTDAPIDELISDTFIITSGEKAEDSQCNWKVFILEEYGDKLCGFLEAYILQISKGCSISPVGIIKGLYVESSFRKNGWGRKLIEKAEQWMELEGCMEIESVVDAYRKAGIEAHKAMGYEITDADDKKVRFKKKVR